MNHLIEYLEYKEFYQFALKKDTYFKPKLSDRVDVYELCSGLYKNGAIFYESNKKLLTGILACYFNDMICKRAFVFLVIVDKKYQNKGLASMLFNHFLNIHCREA